jgi:hypothetical protein
LTRRPAVARSGAWFGGAWPAWSLAALSLLAVRWINPPFTAVHVQRRVQAWMHKTPYHKRYVFVGLDRISPDLQHVVIAAEDAPLDWQTLRRQPGSIPLQVTRQDSILSKQHGVGRLT